MKYTGSLTELQEIASKAGYWLLFEHSEQAIDDINIINTTQKYVNDDNQYAEIYFSDSRLKDCCLIINGGNNERS